MNEEPRVASETVLTIDSLVIESMPGFDTGFPLNGFSKGINLIVGPNSSGKSRTAQALQSLIWPGLGDPAAMISGKYCGRDVDWVVRIHGRSGTYFRDGRAADGPELSGIPQASADRYLLTLHDLLQADNQPLAKEIQRLSAGGYDLRAARENANFPKSDPPRADKQQSANLQAARETVRMIRRQYDQLGAEERQLDQLREEIRKSVDARNLLVEIGIALEHADANVVVSQLDTERATFPPAIAEMNGKELETVAERAAQTDKLRNEQARIEQERASAFEQLKEAGFDLVMPAETLIPALRERAKSIADVSAEIGRLQDELAQERGQVQRSIGQIGDRLSSEQLRSLDADAMRQLAEHMRETVRIQAKFQAQSDLKEWLGTVEAPQDIDQLVQGVAKLYDRLRFVGADSATTLATRLQFALLSAAVLIAILSILLAIEGGTAYIVLAIIAVPFILVAFTKFTPETAGRAASVEQDYLLLQLRPPDSWSASSIGRRLDELRRDLAAAEIAREKATKWSGLEPLRQKLEQEVAQLKESRDRLQAELGISPPPTDWEALRMLAESIDRWRESSERVARQADLLEEKLTQQSLLLAQISEQLIAHGGDAVSDAVEARAALDQLERRIGDAQEATATIARCGTAIAERIVPEIATQEQLITDLYQRFGVDPGDTLTLRELCDRVPAWRKLDMDYVAALANRDRLYRRLDAHPQLRDMQRDQLQDLLIERQELADAYEETLKRREQISSAVDAARRAHELEDALRVETAAIDELEAARTKGLEQAVAWSIWKFVSDRTRDLNRPPVYRHADDLFSRFTSGAFTLEFGEETAKAMFQARETSTGLVLDLDKLSSGTRVQLLMAVRIAFIERLEHGHRLPLLLDETLANTDDIRLRAVIDATIEISRRGRQIFYFTAQQDEIAKWKMRLDTTASDVPHSIIDLAEVRGRSAYLQSDEGIVQPAVFERPGPPESLDHAGAREFLHVARIDPWANGLDHASLWYFVTDLAALLRAHEFGVTTWGRFVTVGRRLLGTMIEQFESIFELAKQRHRAIEVAISQWKIGRCEPLSIEDIKASGAFQSGTFDAVWEVASSSGLDGASTIRSLRENRPDRVTAGRIEKFETYLEQGGKISTTQRLSDQEIRGHVIAAMRGVMSEDDVDDLLRSIFLPPNNESSVV